jgi:hypothetical protein
MLLLVKIYPNPTYGVYDRGCCSAWLGQPVNNSASMLFIAACNKFSRKHSLERVISYNTRDTAAGPMLFTKLAA